MDQIICPYCMSVGQEGKFCTECGRELAHVQDPGEKVLPAGHGLKGDRSGPYFLGVGTYQDRNVIRYAAIDLKTRERVLVWQRVPFELVDWDSEAGTIRLKDHPEAAQRYDRKKQVFLQTNTQLLELSKNDHVLQVIDCFETGGLAFAVTEFVHSVTLGDLVRTNGVLSGGLLQNQLASMLQTLEELQNMGVIHGRMDPEVLLWVPREQNLKISRFGMTEDDDWICTTGEWSDLRYCPPDNLKEPKTRARMDLYSLCACFSYALTGKDPKGPFAETDLSGNPWPKAALETVLRQGLDLEGFRQLQYAELIRQLQPGENPLGVEYDLDDMGWPRTRPAMEEKQPRRGSLLDRFRKKKAD